MTARLLGGALLLAGALWMGRQASRRLRERPRQLRSVISALEILRSNLAALAPLPEAMRRAGRAGGCGGALLLDVAVCMEQENRMLDEIWQEAVRRLPLSNEGLDSLLALGLQLGRYDAATQLRALERCISDFQRWEREAEDKTRQEAGLRLRLIGAAAALLMILLW